MKTEAPRKPGSSVTVYLVSAEIEAPGLEGRGQVGTWAVERSLIPEEAPLILPLESWGALSDLDSDVQADQDLAHFATTLVESDAFARSRQCVR